MCCYFFLFVLICLIYPLRLLEENENWKEKKKLCKLSQLYFFCMFFLPTLFGVFKRKKKDKVFCFWKVRKTALETLREHQGSSGIGGRPLSLSLSPPSPPPPILTPLLTHLDNSALFINLSLSFSFISFLSNRRNLIDICVFIFVFHFFFLERWNNDKTIEGSMGLFNNEPATSSSTSVVRMGSPIGMSTSPYRSGSLLRPQRSLDGALDTTSSASSASLNSHFGSSAIRFRSSIQQPHADPAFKDER